MVRNIKKNSSLFDIITQLLFPKLCYSCQKLLADQSSSTSICPECQAQLEFATNQKQTIYSLYKFNPTIQKLIHLLKYKQKKHLGRKLCYMNKKRIIDKLSPWNIQAIVPVPLYRTRFSQRSYNQSEQIGKALSSILQIPLYPKACKRIHYTQSQTKLSKAEREKNLIGVFRSHPKQHFGEKNLLVVDDVLTTGTTLKQVTLALKKITNGKIYGFTLATANEK